jgi:hypothetical protein
VLQFRGKRDGLLRPVGATDDQALMAALAWDEVADRPKVEGIGEA